MPFEGNENRQQLDKIPQKKEEINTRDMQPKSIKESEKNNLSRKEFLKSKEEQQRVKDSRPNKENIVNSKSEDNHINSKTKENKDSVIDNKTKRLEFPRLSKAEWKEMYHRQEDLCAITGDKLNETMELHHVIPANHRGIRNSETNKFVKDFRRNGVLVNREAVVGYGGKAIDASPHLMAHGGDYGRGAVAPHSWYQYSHGTDIKAHQRWAKEGESFESKLWLKNKQESS